MKLSVPTNWDEQILESCDPSSVDEVYGNFSSDIMGEGNYLFSGVSARDLRGHIKLVRDKGISFNYSLSAVCLDNREWSRGWQRRMEGVLGRLACAGVDRLTVGVPYLLELIKKRYPEFKVDIAAGAHIDSVARARSWVELGADSLILSDVRVNRDFKLIKAIRAAVGCELKLIANNACLQYCPFSLHHSVSNAHAFCPDRGKEGGAVDYNRLKCRHICLSDPVIFLKTAWIRPEDMEFYHSLGIDAFMLVSRVMTTEMLERIINAYRLRRYDADLMDLIWGTSYNNTFPTFNIFTRAPRSFKTDAVLREKAFLRLEDCAVHIDNRGLDGFVQHLYAIGCNAADCGECRFCDKTAVKVMKYDESERLRAVKSLDNSLKALLAAECFDNLSRSRARGGAGKRGPG
ncbi:MAG: U32 family peptidase [Candidatus Omnitrophota bacterium]